MAWLSIKSVPKEICFDDFENSWLSEDIMKNCTNFNFSSKALEFIRISSLTLLYEESFYQICKTNCNVVDSL